MIYPLDFPAKTPSTQRVQLNHRQTNITSVFTLHESNVHNASQWVLEWTWPPMTYANAEMVQAWLDSLKGQVGKFLYAPRQRLTSLLTGRVVAVAAYAYNDSISIGGWTANTATTLRTGQYFQIGDQLFRITQAPLNADANGRALVSFEPQLRKDYAVNTVVNFNTPRGLFRLATSETPTFTLNPDKKPEFPTILAREVV